MKPTIDGVVRAGYAGYDFNRVFSTVFNFCTTDLSSVYFDIRKDTLYCDAPSSLRRRAARTVLDHLFSCLTAWLAPVMVFTILRHCARSHSITSMTCSCCRRSASGADEFCAYWVFSPHVGQT